MVGRSEGKVLIGIGMINVEEERKEVVENKTYLGRGGCGGDHEFGLSQPLKLSVVYCFSTATGC